MIRKHFSTNKVVLAWAIAAAALISSFSIAPQIDLWAARGAEWKGIYAVNDLDEPFYAAYLQSLIDGKPRKNSPYTGAHDSLETPQRESYLSIQMLASYPLALAARIFGLTSSTLMIWIGLVAGFCSGAVMFWLFYLFTKNAPFSFVGTVVVLFGGALAGGQGSFFGLFFDSGHYVHSLIFMRRSLPAVAFPILFLFFICVWKFLTAESNNKRIIFGFLSVLCFAFNVYSYFYFWTTAAAWFGGLIILWLIFRYEDLKKIQAHLLGVIIALLAALVPYFLLILDRSTEVDSALSLKATRQPEPWHIPEIISYAAILIFLIADKKDWFKLREPRILFLFSFSLVPLIVFNQQILTGYTLQPFHYAFFCANYIALFSLFIIAFLILKKRLTPDGFNKILLITAAAAIIIGYYDTVSGTYTVNQQNLWRDKLMPAARRISQETYSANTKQTILSLDLTTNFWANSIDLPALTSQPVLWEIHMTMFPDVNAEENTERLFKFIYYHNFDKNKLEKEFYSGTNGMLLQYGFFGAERVSSLYTGERSAVTSREIDEIIEQYGKFYDDFSYEDARSPQIHFVLAYKHSPSDMSTIDRWYSRDAGEEIGEYILYRVRLRDP